MAFDGTPGQGLGPNGRHIQFPEPPPKELFRPGPRPKLPPKLKRPKSSK